MDYIARARALRTVIEKAANSLPDEDAGAAKELFAEWSGDGVNYEENDKVRSNGLLYKCLQEHTSNAGWNPEQATALWSRIPITNSEG